MRIPTQNESTTAGEREARHVLRVYYEDTDFSGFVYHASYLRFLERARTEWLRAIGFEQRELKHGAALTFALRRLQINYLRPATMDDVLIVGTRIRRTRGASIDFVQTIVRGDEKIIEATVSVALLKSGRPARIPPAMRARLLQAAEPGESAAKESEAADLQGPIESRGQ